MPVNLLRFFLFRRSPRRRLEAERSGRFGTFVRAETEVVAAPVQPLMMGRGSGPQMLMIDVYYRYGQHGDFATASALGVVSYLLAMGAALVYLRRLTT